MGSQSREPFTTILRSSSDALLNFGIADPLPFKSTLHVVNNDFLQAWVVDLAYAPTSGQQRSHND